MDLENVSPAPRKDRVDQWLCFQQKNADRNLFHNNHLFGYVAVIFRPYLYTFFYSLCVVSPQRLWMEKDLIHLLRKYLQIFAAV